jgi:hypothetical protein
MPQTGLPNTGVEQSESLYLRYQRGNQNLYIEEEQKTQWIKDTKGAIRICISKIPKGQSESLYLRYQRDNQNLYIEEEQTTQWPKDTKGAIRICISKKNRLNNG